ncbi:MAG: PAS domain-containing protein [Nannocystaceae bacterium]|nr:PAS domain-containing protein [Nannocystaceae bacterium]
MSSTDPRATGMSESGVSGETAATMSQSGATAPRPGEDASDQARRRRIAYFMLFRLGMLTVFTVLAAALAYAADSDATDASDAATVFVWSTLGAAFALTAVFARLLPKVRDLSRFAWLQTTTDIVLAAVVVQMSGGADSGFQWLFLIAVLGAAMMGDQRMTWGAAGACLLILFTLGTLQWTEVIEPTILGEPIPRLKTSVLWLALGRTTAALVGVTLLSSYLGRQLSTSVSEVGVLRLLNDHIVRSLSSGLITVDRDGRVLYFNPAAARILNLSADRIGDDVGQPLPGLEAAVGNDDGGRTALTLDSPVTGTMHLGLSRVPLRDASGERVGVLINFTDLTQLQDLTERLRRNERLAALGGLAASVAHEIRNPLTAIAGSAELLGSTPELDPQDSRLVRVIQRESNRLSDLITDLLAFTRPKQPHYVRLSLAGAVRDTREAFSADPMNKGVAITLRIIDDEPVFVDPAQLSQVIWNLIRNAAEAMERRGKITIEIRREGDRCCMDIADDGPGIPPERIERVFDPFFTTKEHGTGFGLAIVHRVVEDNGGSIHVASTPGNGATFALSFPAADSVQSEKSGVFDV